VWASRDRSRKRTARVCVSDPVWASRDRSRKRTARDLRERSCEGLTSSLTQSGRTRLTAFLVIAYAASWWAWPLVLLSPTTTALVPIGPTIAAIVVTALGGGAGELRTLLGRLVRWPVHSIWYAVAFLLPVALFGLPVVVMIGFGVSVEATGPFPWAALPLLFAIRMIVGGPLGE